MDVTPSPGMLRAMQALADASIGEEPNKLDLSPGAGDRRVKRQHMMTVLHTLVALSMREGVNRAVREALERRAGPRDMADRNAMAQAHEDAIAGRTVTRLPQ